MFYFHPVSLKNPKINQLVFSVPGGSDHQILNRSPQTPEKQQVENFQKSFGFLPEKNKKNVNDFELSVQKMPNCNFC